MKETNPEPSPRIRAPPKKLDLHVAAGLIWMPGHAPTASEPWLDPCQQDAFRLVRDDRNLGSTKERLNPNPEVQSISFVLELDECIGSCSILLPRSIPFLISTTMSYKEDL